MNIVRAEDYHVPVMLQECLEGMQLRPEGCYVDVTFGGGGHSRAILKELQGAGMLYSFDQDPDAAARAPQQPCFTFIASNFRHLARFMDYYDRLGQVDAILADLGVSSHHFDAMERGFSFRDETPLLDMRMNNRAGLSARDLLNSYEEEQLADVLYRYGELKQSRSLAKLIVKARSVAPLQTVGDLIAAIRPALRPDQEKKLLACIFQALRIEVNGELKALEELLEASLCVLRPGGRLVVMTYHSLEDRIVKNFLKGTDDSAEAQIYGTARSAWRLVTRKPLVASAEELERNPRSRSAKLRIAERIR
ncbi:16S rRNA (cytosine(1402)-N(4))-methyltransferase RsmH [Porphyromonas sp. oral taxon 275]|uniref:16S rRNA (cytosine(1402)-N(4))-methyltransferase RsmH n=1 Tax=Porphyromonas sp. oral taxon 275 TaxID=712435 RepID=UPI001BAC79F0|nr:16S rRNA (cytosine(1402)-N(4))-methyltransferase RsmH [Porphyromonas sp. oral taxon 275]QUB42456.1 16S rRNA (cytosine(1402)-N(4))-methyltransferase RsmH [Porphyromonas sp. oral taxon 275]